MVTRYVLLTVDIETTRTLDKPENVKATFTIGAARGERPMILWYDAEGYMYAYTRDVDGNKMHCYRKVPADDITELTPDA